MLLLILLSFFGSTPAQADYSQVCRQYRYVEDQENCMVRLRNRNYDNSAIAVCRQYHYLEDQQNCLLALSNKRFRIEEVNVCRQYRYVEDQQNCLSRVGIADNFTQDRQDRLNHTLEQMRVCQGFQTAPERAECMRIVDRSLNRISFSSSSLNEGSGSVLSGHQFNIKLEHLDQRSVGVPSPAAAEAVQAI